MADAAAGFMVRQVEPDELADEKERGGKQAQRDRILETVLAAGITFWRDADGTAYATVPSRDGAAGRVGPQRYRVQSRLFRLLVRHLYGAENRRALPNGTVIPGSVSDTAMNE